MTEQIQRRWGIVAVGIVMVFVTLISNAINGQKTSFYYFVWILVAYYGYKGNLVSIKEWMKWLIFINIGVLFFVIAMFDSSMMGYMNADGKDVLAVGVLVMLLPKIALYFYADSELKQENLRKSNQVNLSAKNVSENNLYKESVQDTLNTLKVARESMTNKINQKSEILSQTVNDKKDNVEQIEASSKSNIEKSTNQHLDELNENDLWETVLSEYDSNNRIKGLWAKCFANADGDENKAKAAYLRARIDELINSAKRQNAEKDKTENEIKASIQAAKNLEKLEREQNEYGIIFDGEKYLYKEYMYDKLEDAIRYAKKVSIKK